MSELKLPQSLGGALAIITGSYPGISQTFIDREIKALRAARCDIVTVTIRAPDERALAGTFQRAEANRVHRVVASAKNPLTVCRAISAAAMRPRHLLSTLRLAIAARPSGGLRALAFHAAYLVEAILLADFLRRRGIGHAHNHLGDASGTVTMLASELAGVPFSMTLHGPEVFAQQERWRLDVKISKACATICISDDGCEKAQGLCAPVHRDKVSVVRCGVNLPLYEAEGAMRTGRKLLFIGRLVPRKECSVLIEALAAVRASGFNTELAIVGDGPEKENLARLVAERGLGGSVQFLGVLDEVEVANALRTVDVLVVPSSSEGLPVVIMEAFASQLPVIASKVDGIPELVRDGETGILVPPRDPQRLASAIKQVLSQPAMARRMGAAGYRLVVSRHDANRNASLLLQAILSDAVTGIGGRPKSSELGKVGDNAASCGLSHRVEILR